MQKTRCAQVGPAEESAGGGGAIAEHVFSIAEFDVMNNGIAPEQAKTRLPFQRPTETAMADVPVEV